MRWLPSVFLLFCLLTTAQAARTNILFIVADDLRPELGCYGVIEAKTPNIDRLASRGVRFNKAYCQYPVCNPSRVSFLTGLRPHQTKVLDNNLHFRKTLPEVVTLPQLFRDQGYVTASLGKVFHRGLTMEQTRPEMDDAKSWDDSRFFQSTPAGLKGQGRNLTGGRVPWCRWLAAEGADEDQPDGQIARAAIDFLRDHREKPFFLALGFHKPHDPFIAPKKYFDLYPLEEIPLAKPDNLPAPHLAFALGNRAWSNEFANFSELDRREFKRAYLAGVSFMDAQVGKVLRALDELKLSDRTMVVFLGDHGYHLGEKGWWNKSTLFELSARTPLIVALPGAKGGNKSSESLVELIDLYPTLAEICAVKPPPALSGRSFQALLHNPTLEIRDAAFTQVKRGAVHGHSIRTSRWRYTEWDGGAVGRELYDHSRDPSETTNLVNERTHEATFRELSQRLRQTLPRL